ncbi:hypothetical protein SLA2020_173010 [Shorea laevis]
MLSHTISAEDAFKIVQIELGFLHDKLYTKPTVLQSIKGKILQSICLATFAAVIAFSITVDNHGYPWEDIYVTSCWVEQSLWTFIQLFHTPFLIGQYPVYPFQAIRCISLWVAQLFPVWLILRPRRRESICGIRLDFNFETTRH